MKEGITKLDQTTGIKVFSQINLEEYNQNFKFLFAREIKKLLDKGNPKYNLIISDLTRLPQVVGEKGFENLKEVKLVNGETLDLEELYKEYNKNYKIFKTKNKVFEFGNKQIKHETKGFGFEEKKYGLGYDELKEAYEDKIMDIEKMGMTDLVIMLRILAGALPYGVTTVIGGIDDIKQAGSINEKGLNFDGSIQGIGENILGYLSGVLGIIVVGGVVRSVIKGPNLLKITKALGIIIDRLSKSGELGQLGKNEKFMSLLVSIKLFVPGVGDFIEKIKTQTQKELVKNAVTNSRKSRENSNFQQHKKKNEYYQIY